MHFLVKYILLTTPDLTMLKIENKAIQLLID